MAGYLIAEEGPLSGLTIRFEDGSEWVLGRDPDVAGMVLEDPMVSRKHVICRLTPEGYVLENLSSVNPATQNGKIITEPVLLHEGDIIQIGNTFFRFTEHVPHEGSEPYSPLSTDAALESSPELSSLSISPMPETRWLMKVMSGPNAGAEFHMEKGASYVIGKDPSVCEIVFQDLTVSRQHARIGVDEEENIFIEDLGSRNGTLVNGSVITERKQLQSQDKVALGTTSFLVIDRESALQTIVPESAAPAQEEKLAAQTSAAAKPLHWKEMVISKKHLVFGGVLCLIALFSLLGMLSLFQTEPIAKGEKHEGDKIAVIVKTYPDIQFSYNDGSGKLFITGHVLTAIEKQELIYQLRNLPFLTDMEDTIVIDEYVWQNMNALLATNPDWQGVSIHSPAPGRFVMRGYLQTPEQAAQLGDYININFPYLDRLDNRVVVENTLNTQIDSMLIEKGFNNVTFQITNGEVVFSGRADGRDESKFNDLVKEFKVTPGIRSLKNYVIFTSEDSSLVDLTPKYKVMGYSKKDGESHFVVIGGKILTVGDTLDGMMITAIHSSMVVLEKDGLKFKINYNLQ